MNVKYKMPNLLKKDWQLILFDFEIHSYIRTIDLVIPRNESVTSVSKSFQKKIKKEWPSPPNQTIPPNDIRP